MRDYQRLKDLPVVAQQAVVRAENHGWKYEVTDWRGAYLAFPKRVNSKIVVILVDPEGDVQVS